MGLYQKILLFQILNNPRRKWVCGGCVGSLMSGVPESLVINCFHSGKRAVSFVPLKNINTNSHIQVSLFSSFLLFFLTVFILIFLSVCLHPSISLFLSFSLALSLLHTHTLSLYLSLSNTHSISLSFSLSVYTSLFPM